jgi:hypothetical protein
MNRETIVAIANLAAACFEFQKPGHDHWVERTKFAQLLYLRRFDRIEANSVILEVRAFPFDRGICERFVLGIEPGGFTIGQFKMSRQAARGVPQDEEALAAELLLRLAEALAWHARRAQDYAEHDDHFRAMRRALGALTRELDAEGMAFEGDDLKRKDGTSLFQLPPTTNPANRTEVPTQPTLSPEESTPAGPTPDLRAAEGLRLEKATVSRVLAHALVPGVSEAAALAPLLRPKRGSDTEPSVTTPTEPKPSSQQAPEPKSELVKTGAAKPVPEPVVNTNSVVVHVYGAPAPTRAAKRPENGAAEREKAEDEQSEGVAEGKDPEKPKASSLLSSLRKVVTKRLILPVVGTACAALAAAMAGWIHEHPLTGEPRLGKDARSDAGQISWTQKPFKVNQYAYVQHAGETIHMRANCYWPNSRPIDCRIEPFFHSDAAPPAANCQAQSPTSYATSYPGAKMDADCFVSATTVGECVVEFLCIRNSQ